VFVTTEVTTPAYYKGKDRHRQVPNLLFRMGAAAVLLSNNAVSWGGRVKYQLKHHERVHAGQSEESYK
jgi:3-ketoacyl-CoA synthase